MTVVKIVQEIQNRESILKIEGNAKRKKLMKKVKRKI